MPAREIESGSLDGGDDGEHNTAEFAEISKIHETQATISSKTELVDRFWREGGRGLLEIFSVRA